jgi:hypothetical protein
LANFWLKQIQPTPVKNREIAHATFPSIFTNKIFLEERFTFSDFQEIPKYSSSVFTHIFRTRRIILHVSDSASTIFTQQLTYGILQTRETKRYQREDQSYAAKDV